MGVADPKEKRERPKKSMAVANQRKKKVRSDKSKEIRLLREKINNMQDELEATGPWRRLKKGVYQYRFLDHHINFINENEMRLYTKEMRRRRYSSESSQNVDTFMPVRGGALLYAQKERRTRLEEKLIDSYERYDLFYIETYRRLNVYSQYDIHLMLKDKWDDQEYIIDDDVYDVYKKIRNQRAPFELRPRVKKGKCPPPQMRKSVARQFKKVLGRKERKRRIKERIEIADRRNRRKAEKMIEKIEKREKERYINFYKSKYSNKSKRSKKLQASDEPTLENPEKDPMKDVNKTKSKPALSKNKLNKILKEVKESKKRSKSKFKQEKVKRSKSNEKKSKMSRKRELKTSERKEGRSKENKTKTRPRRFKF